MPFAGADQPPTLPLSPSRASILPRHELDIAAGQTRAPERASVRRSRFEPFTISSDINQTKAPHCSLGRCFASGFLNGCCVLFQQSKLPWDLAVALSAPIEVGDSLKKETQILGADD